MGQIKVKNFDGVTVISEIDLSILDLDKTLNCGQAFRWTKVNSLPGYIVYKGFIKNNLTLVAHNIVKNELCTNYDYDKINEFIDYFNLELDYDYIMSNISLDKYAQDAYNFGRGIRILHQDLWETIITFIISQRNRVEKIANSVEAISRAFGDKVDIKINNVEYTGYTFPSPEQIYEDKEKLYSLSLGYRADYIYALVCDIINGRNNILSLDNKLSTEYLNYELQSIKGIGPKVANCILLFGYNKYEAFPIDTWINKVITNNYNGYLNIENFGNYAGIVQQFLFYYAKYKS